VDKTNFLPLVAGQAEPSGLLPLQMPANMEAVEDQASGTPRDMDCYEDAAGNTYDFAFGLNWAGQIEDERTERFAVDVQVGLE
jgi:beta-glucosidase